MLHIEADCDLVEYVHFIFNIHGAAPGHHYMICIISIGFLSGKHPRPQAHTVHCLLSLRLNC